MHPSDPFLVFLSSFITCFIGGKTQYSIASVYSVQTWMPSFAVNYLNCGFLLLITAAYTVHRVCHNYPDKEEFELWQSYVNPVSWKRVIPTFSFTRATGPFTRRNVTRLCLLKSPGANTSLKTGCAQNVPLNISLVRRVCVWSSAETPVQKQITQ